MSRKFTLTRFNLCNSGQDDIRDVKLYHLKSHIILIVIVFYVVNDLTITFEVIRKKINIPNNVKFIESW